MRNIKPAMAGAICALSIALSAGVSAAATGVSDHTAPLPTYAVPRGTGKSDVSLNVDNAPVQGVLRLLFRFSNQSYVLGPRVVGNVTASLHKVPVDTALSQILTANSVPLTKAVVNGIYVIKGPRTVPGQSATPGRQAGAPNAGRRWRSRTPWCSSALRREYCAGRQTG